MWENFEANISAKINDRDQLQQPLNNIMEYYEKCVEDLLVSHKKISGFNCTIEKYKTENNDLQTTLIKYCKDGVSDSFQEQDIKNILDAKFKALQQENQEVLDKNKDADIKFLEQTKINEEYQKTVNQLKLSIINKDKQITNLEYNLKIANINMNELKTTNQLLIDEQQALQLAFESLEHKFARCKEENNELLERWLKQKSRDIDRANLENEEFQKKVTKKMSQELLDAAKEMFINLELPSVRNMISSPNTRISLPSPTPSNLYSKAIIPTRLFYEIPQSHESEVTALASLPFNNDKSFATGGMDRKIKLWEIGTNSCDLKHEFIGCSGGVTSIQFDLNGTYLLASSNDFATRLWSVSDQRLRHTLTGHSGKVLSAKFLDGSSKVVTGSYDRTLKIWDISNKTCIETLFAGSSCNDLIVLDKAGCIISGHIDKKLRLWDIRIQSSNNKGSSITEGLNKSIISNTTGPGQLCKNHDNQPSLEISLPAKITSISTTQEQSQILFSSRDDILRILDVRFSKLSKSSFNGDAPNETDFVASLRAPGFHVAYDWSRAAFSPDKKFAACGSSDGLIYVWDLLDNTHTKLNSHSNNSVMCTLWTLFGTYFLACDNKRKTFVWS